jgi:DNA-binding NarL/FixJ family response regulator
MQAGAVGYLLKDISANELVIRAMHSGQINFLPEANKIMIHAAT